MDEITHKAVRQHLATTTENLQHANNVPLDLALAFLTEARNHLDAAIDTIQQARAVEFAGRLDLTTLGRAESLASLAGTHA